MGCHSMPVSKEARSFPFSLLSQMLPLLLRPRRLQVSPGFTILESINADRRVELDREPTIEPANGYSSSSNESDHNAASLTAERVEFIKTYSSIKPECMWKLSTGRRVETVIYDTVMKMEMDESSQSLLRWFILDLTDPETARLFPSAELEEMKAAFPPLPPPDAELHSLISPFFKVFLTTRQLAKHN